MPLFLFDEGFDIKPDVFKSTQTALSANSLEKFNEGYFFPVVQRWLKVKLKTIVQTDVFSIDQFLSCTSVNFYPNNFCLIIEYLLKLRFSDEVLKAYEEELNGIELYLELKKEYKVLDNVTRIGLLQNFFMETAKQGALLKNFNEKVYLMTYYFPHLKKCIPLIAFFHLSNVQRDQVLLRKDLADQNESNVESLEESKHTEIIAFVERLTKKGIISETSKIMEITDEVNYHENNSKFLKNVRCYRCHKFGHYMDHCPLNKLKKNPKKYHEVQYIELPIGADVYYSTKSESDDEEEANLIEHEEEVFLASDIEFIIDSGATCHVVSDKSVLHNVSTSQTAIKGVDGHTVSTLEGDLTLGNLCLSNVKVMPNSNRNIISGDILSKKGFKIELDSDKVCISKNGKTFLECPKKGRLWSVTSSDIKNEIALTTESAPASTADTSPHVSNDSEIINQHIAAGHASAKVLNSTYPYLGTTSKIDKALKNYNCSTCFNQVNKTKGSRSEKIFVAGELLQVDTIGPIDGSYAVIMSDRCTKFTIARVISSKSEVSNTAIMLLKRFQNLLSVTDKKIVYLRSDNEYDTHLVNDFCNNNGILLQLTAPHSSYQNGFAEVQNYLYEDKVKKLLDQSKVDKSLWKYALLHLVFLNNSICRPGSSKTPYEQIRDTVMIHDSFIPFGCEVIAYNYDNYQKIFKKNIHGVFLGYHGSTKIIFVLCDDGKVIKTSAFKANPRTFPLTTGNGFDNGFNGFSGGSGSSGPSGGSTGIFSGGSFRSSSGESSSFSNNPFSVLQNNEHTTEQLVSDSSPIAETTSEYTPVSDASDDTEMDDNIVKDAFHESQTQSSLPNVNDVTTSPIQNTTLDSAMEKIPEPKLVHISNQTATTDLVCRDASLSPIQLSPIHHYNSSTGLTVQELTSTANDPIVESPISPASNTISSTPDQLLLESSMQQNNLIRSISNTSLDNQTPSSPDPLKVVANPRHVKARITHGDNCLKVIKKYRKPASITQTPLKMLTYSSDNNEFISDHEDVNLLVNKSKYDIPFSYSDVLKSPQKNQWLEAMKKELDSFDLNDVVEVVDRSTVSQPIIPSRWVHVVKSEGETERFKSRIVAKGFKQELGKDYIDIYAPVCSYEMLRFVLNMVVQNDWDLCQLDVTTAFLHGPIDHKVYLNPPAGAGVDSSKVWKLKRAVYGLKQAPSVWFKTISEVLKNMNYSQSELEPCLFYKDNSLLPIYVDDSLIGAPGKIINEIKMAIKKKFPIKDSGFPKVFLGMNINKTAKGGIKICLNDFLNKVQNDYKLSKETKVSTPLVKGFNPYESSPLLNEKEHKDYQSIVGVINFTSNTCRPDISFAASLLSRFLTAPTKQHIKAAHRVIHYLIQTKEKGISYEKHKSFEEYRDFQLLNTTKEATIHNYPKQEKYTIKVVSDSDHGSDINDRKSQSGYCVFINNNLITWGSRKQKSVSISSCEAEYYALSEATRSALFFRNVMQELKLPVAYIDLLADNKSALTMASHKFQHQKTKHIAIHYHFVRNLVLDKEIRLGYINTANNIADLLTKPLDSTTFNNLTNKILY